MLQKMKRPLSLICMVMLCLSLVSGIVLPELADTALAVDDPYAAADGQFTSLTPVTGEDSSVTVTTTGIAVGETTYGGGVALDTSAFSVDTVYDATGKVYFYNPAWTANDLNITDEVGTPFLVQYGDGTTWGNGKVYVAYWRVNAFGAKQYNAATSLDGGTTLAEADSKTGWVDMLNTLRHITPVADGDNSQYVFLLPGSTSATAVGITGLVEYQTATPTDAKATVAEFERSDYTNVYFYGPQAGKSPVSETAGNTDLLDNRSTTDSTTEFIATSTFWLPVNAVYHFDGIAMKGSCKMHLVQDSETASVTGLYMDNLVAQFSSTSDSAALFTIGETYTGEDDGTADTQNRAAVFHLTNSYYYGTVKSARTSVNTLQVNDLKIDNCVFKDIAGKDSDADSMGLALVPASESAQDTAFLGDYRNSANIEFTNNTVENWDCGRLFVIKANAYGVCDTVPTILIDNNRFENIGKTGVANYPIQFVDVNSKEEKDGTVTDTADPNNADFVFTNNHFSASDAATAAENNYYMFNTSNNPSGGTGSITFTGNTVIADVEHSYKYEDNYSSALLLDLSGNLFLDADNNVRVPIVSYCTDNYTGNAKVLSDVYASDDYSGGLKELFTVQGTSVGAIVTGSFVQTILQVRSGGTTTARAEYGTDILGTVVLLLEDGKKYSTKDMFTYVNDDVELLGVYSNVACTKPVSSIAKGFSTGGTTPLYAKAQYKSGTTTATILYAIYEPTNIEVVAPNSETSYTFNGTTYTDNDSDVNFHASVTDAYDSNTMHAFGAGTTGIDGVEYNTNMILLMPGTYADAITIEETTAIVGPHPFTSASDGKTSAIANGRSYTESASEAILTGGIAIKATNAPYVTIAGVAANPSGKFIIYTPTGDWANTDNNTTKTLSFMNVSNVCLNTTSGEFIAAGYFTDNASNYPKYNAVTTVSGCYVNLNYKRAVAYACNYFSMRDTTFIYTGDNSNSFMYMIPLPLAAQTSRVAGSSLEIEDCYLSLTGAKNYSLGYRTKYYTKVESCDAVSALKNKASIKLNRNVIDMNTEKPTVRLMIAAKDSLTLDVTDNALTYADSTTANFLEYNDTSAIDSNPAMDVTFEGNAIINNSVPVNLPGNSVKLDNNYFGSDDGEILAVTSGSDYGTAKDPFTYYVDPEMTATNKDLALVDGGFESAKITNTTSFADWSMALTAKTGETYTLADFETEKGEVTAVTNAEGASVFDAETGAYTPTAGETINVTVAYSDFTCTWAVTVTTTAGPWADAGLAPTDDDDHTVDVTDAEGNVTSTTTQTYVDLTTQDLYAARSGGNAYGVVMLAPSFVSIAHKTYEGAVNDSTDDLFTTTTYTEPTATEPVAPAADDTSLDYYDMFYVKMPSTGTVYKVTFGMTAGDIKTTNPGVFGTMVYFPGTYDSGSGYGDTTATKNSINEKRAFGLSFVKSGTLAVGHSIDSSLAKNATEYRILGPQAGISPVTVDADGAATKTLSTARTTSTATEAVFSANRFYIMNAALKEGATVTFDGLTFTDTVYVDTAAGSNASNMYNTASNSAISVENCYCDDTTQTVLFRVRGYWKDGSTNSTHKTTHNVEFNLRDTYIASANTTNIGELVTNNIKVDRCAVVSSKNVPVFSFDPLSNDENSTLKNVSYTCENSYVETSNGPLFKMNGDATSGLNAATRNGIEFKVTDNTVKGISNLVEIAVGSDADDTAAMAAITSIVVTDNNITIGEGRMLSSYGTEYPLLKADVKHNNISGYMGTANYIMVGFTDDVDFAYNYYTNTSGKVLAAHLGSGYVSDVALNDSYTAFASDYAITAGARMNYVPAWRIAGGDIYAELNETARASVTYTEGMTIADIKSGLDFASDNVTIHSLTDHEGNTPTEVVAVDSSYLLTVKHSITNTPITYTLTVVGDGTVAEGVTDYYDTTLIGKYFFDNALSGAASGQTVIYDVELEAGEMTPVQFTVGENVFGSLLDFPMEDGNVLNIYLFAKEYELGTLSATGLVGQDMRGTTFNFIGAKAGVTAVADTDDDDIPDARNPERADLDFETVLTGTTKFNPGYQANQTWDGVTFAGGASFGDGSGAVKVTQRIALQNCSTDESRPMEIVSHDGILFTSANCPVHFDVRNSYLVVGEESEAGFIVGSDNADTQNVAEVDIIGNYIRTPEHVGVAALAGGDSMANSSYHPDADYINITGNNLDGAIEIGHAHDSGDENGTPTVVIGGNLFDNGDKVLAHYIKLSDESYTKLGTITISSNTFNNGNGLVDYAIVNESETTADASGANIFNGFGYNYGNAEYLDGGVAAEVGDGAAPTVLLSNGDNHATFVFGENEYPANADNSALFGMIDVAMSGVGMVDSDAGTITDIAPGAEYYVFNTGSGMMVKATIGEAVYYNAIPLSADLTEVTTVEVIKLNGDSVTETAYTATIYRAPITVTMGDINYEDSTEYTNPYATYWQGKVVSANGLDLSALLSQHGFKVLDYGMYYGLTEDAVSDAGIANYVANDHATTTAILKDENDKTIGQKESYVKDENGLSKVHLEYSLRMHNVAAGKTRWGRMYLTYKVGGTIYTVYSDAASVTIPAVANAQ